MVKTFVKNRSVLRLRGFAFTFRITVNVKLKTQIFELYFRVLPVGVEKHCEVPNSKHTIPSNLPSDYSIHRCIKNVTLWFNLAHHYSIPN